VAEALTAGLVKLREAQNEPEAISLALSPTLTGMTTRGFAGSASAQFGDASAHQLIGSISGQSPRG
jgi:hypothetical protein